MSVALEERPVFRAGATGGAPARRAMVRWSWRLFRREWRRQALVLALAGGGGGGDHGGARPCL